ncbi:MAG: hypothetical protein JJE18_04565 [Eubacteriaceae bacterium]|nr:hypothetical protein [Eubacteriaceae bacterium]
MAYEQKTVTINEVDYTMQKLPTRQWIRARQKYRDKDGMPKDEELYDYLLENVVISPKLIIDDFEENQDLEELMEAVMMFHSKRKSKDQKAE